MGVDKLLLPWNGGKVIDYVVAAWRAAGVESVVVVVDPACVQRIEHLRKLPVDVVVPAKRPEQMKDSVQFGLRFIEEKLEPADDDLWLLAPGDVPELSPGVIHQVIKAARDHPGKIVVPVHGSRRGHPASFPWRLACEVGKLGSDEGVRELLNRHPTLEVECGPAATSPDIDTPDDYQRLRDAAD